MSKNLLHKSIALLIMLTLGVAACTSADDATGANEIPSGTGVTTVEDTGAEPLESSDESAVEVPAFGDANAENHFVGNDANSDDLLENGLSDVDDLNEDDDDDDLGDDDDDNGGSDDDRNPEGDDDADDTGTGGEHDGDDDDDSEDGGDDARNNNESDDDENSEDGEKDDGGD